MASLDIRNPSISFPQDYEFEEGEESEGDVSTYVDKWDDVTFNVDKQDHFLESKDISLAKSILDPNAKIISPNLKLVDPTPL